MSKIVTDTEGELKTVVTRLRDLDPFIPVSQQLYNEFIEGLRYQHAVSPYDLICSKCGASQLDIYKRIKKGCDDVYIDTYKDNTLIIRERRAPEQLPLQPATSSGGEAR